MSPDELRERLFELEDPGYKAFHLKTCPNARHMIGVRVPEQRKLARLITKSDFWQFLDTVQPYHYEEIMITGIVIASAPMGLAEHLDYVIWFLPLIDNWAVCDTFCASFRPQPADLATIWDFLLQLTSSREEFVLRFVLVMLLDYFLLPEYLALIFQLLDELHSNQHYVNMAKAWLVAEAFAKHRDATLDYLSRDQLGTATHNKAIQKACESRRVSSADKTLLASLRL